MALWNRPMVMSPTSKPMSHRTNFFGLCSLLLRLELIGQQLFSALVCFVIVPHVSKTQSQAFLQIYRASKNVFRGGALVGFCIKQACIRMTCSQQCIDEVVVIVPSACKWIRRQRSLKFIWLTSWYKWKLLMIQADFSILSHNYLCASMSIVCKNSHYLY